MATCAADRAILVYAREELTESNPKCVHPTLCLLPNHVLLLCLITKFQVTVFSDMTPEEFRGAYLMPSIDVGDAKNSCLAHGVTAKPMAVNDLPTSIDWRDKVSE